MNSLHLISILSWVAMWLAFHWGHPAGYVIALIGFAASAAIAHEPSAQPAEGGQAMPAEPAREQAVPLVRRAAKAKRQAAAAA